MHLVHQVVDLLLPFGGLVTEALRSSPSSGTAFDIGDGASVNDELASVVAAGLTSSAPWRGSSSETRGMAAAAAARTEEEGARP